jgi:hypothetical protein
VLAAFIPSCLSTGQARALGAPVVHPIARALIGKSKGDTVEVAAPGGARSYEILKVEFV